MKAGLIETMRREGVRLRGSLFVVFCLSVLALLAAGPFLPRTYVSDAVLSFGSDELGAMPAALGQLRALAARHPDGELSVETRGRELRLGWTSGHPAAVRETLQGLIDTLVEQTRQALADALEADATHLERELQEVRERQGGAQRALADALAAMPEGGNAAAGARLGKLQAEADALALEIRGARTRQAELEARVQELETAIDEARPDATGVQELERQLQEAQGALARTAVASAEIAGKAGSAAQLEGARAEHAKAQQQVDALSRSVAQAREALAEAGTRRAGLVARHASAQEELANLLSTGEDNRRRERQLRGLIEEARGELVRLEGENEQIQQLDRAVTAADAELRAAETGLARHAETVERMRQGPELPFVVSSSPGKARVGRGLPVWQQVLLALAAGLLLAFARLVLAALSVRGAKSLVRLADELQVKALVELPLWRDPMADPAARWRRAGALLLGLLTAAACIVSLRVA
ncbi:MAG: hypothetical protein KBG29_08700 [Pseudomonadales bacterium]|nr:hypothetical protein [Gammaproteobacteria bacterium]MBP9033962.1 hypothetical protein [Pseudomonadales bacterium]